MGNRSVEIRRNVEALSERVVRACERAGRRAGDVTVIAISKRFPLQDIRYAYECGIRHVGENRVQELVEKFDGWSAAYPGSDLRWHMVGHLQRNKAKDILGRCAMFHALDSMRLARALQDRAESENVDLDCLVQVNVSGEQSKFGFDPAGAEQAVRMLGQYERLRIRGVMTLAHPADDPEEVRPEFAKLRRLFERIQSGSRTACDILSMGMSGDFEVGIEEGATHIRVGTAIFGPRP